MPVTLRRGRSPRPAAATATPDRANVGAIAALATSSFVFVTAETLPVGLLPQISKGLSVSEAHTGLLLTTYAAIAAISTIPATAFTMRIPRNRLIMALVVIFTTSQLGAAIAPTFLLLVCTRLVAALVHGVFWSALAPVTARLAPPGQAGRATSWVFIGNSLAIVLGVPLGTALGQLLGWRIAFAAIGVAGGLSAMALAVVLPSMPALPKDLVHGAATRLRSATKIITSREITPVCAITTVLVIGQFAAYTYIAPLARHSAGLDGLALSALLLGYGAVGLAGNILAGRAIDRAPGLLLAGCTVATALALAALGLSTGAPVTVIAILAWGASFSAVPLCLQSAILRVAPHAQDAASAVYVVAFQIGIGAGSLLGEQIVSDGRLASLPAVGAVLAALSSVMVITSRRAFPWRLKHKTELSMRRAEPVDMTAPDPA